MFQLMHVSRKISTAPDSQPLRLNSNNAEISFNNVRFEYLPGQPILNGLTFTVPAGQSYAIVGGKQTWIVICSYFSEILIL